MALITVVELEAFMGRDFSVGVEETQAEAIIDMVTSMVESYTGTSFTPVVDDVITIQADGQGIVELYSKPVTTVTSVKDINGQEVTDWDFDGMATIYNLYPLQVVDITYSHGYQEVPSDIKAVALGASSRIMYNPSGLRQETVGAISVTYPGVGGEAGTINLSRLEREVLDKYARVSQSMRLKSLSRKVSGLPVLTIDNVIA